MLFSIAAIYCGNSYFEAATQGFENSPTNIYRPRHFLFALCYSLRLLLSCDQLAVILFAFVFYTLFFPWTYFEILRDYCPDKDVPGINIHYHSTYWLHSLPL